MPNLKVCGSSIMDMGLEQSSGLQTHSQLTKPMLYYTFLSERPTPSAVLAPLPLTSPSRPTSPRHHVTGSPRGVQSADRRAPRVRLRRSRPPWLGAAATERAAGTGPPSSDGIVKGTLPPLKKLMNWHKSDVIRFRKCKNKYLPVFAENYLRVF